VRIAVISDTHDHCPPGLAELLMGADEIWHLGDVCEPEILGEIARFGPPLQVVQGNCDTCLDWPADLTLERAGHRLHLVHIPPPRPPLRVHAVLHGHTHVPRDELVGNVRWLNPGSLSRPRGGPPSFAWLTLEKGRSLAWRIVAL
jgi:uncharacterized protein